MTRSSGVLMHISSLPGAYGIGCFGDEVISFAKALKAAGFTYWQILPFSWPGMGDSPYQSFSAYAGNIYFISPDKLAEYGLLTEADLAFATYHGSSHKVDFAWLRANRAILFRRAYERMTPIIEAEVEAFLNRNTWLDDAALFLTIKEQNAHALWWKWEEEALRFHEKAALARVRVENKSEYMYHCFLQYLFFRQWSEVKSAIHEVGISIIGDIPIYVSDDSADVWAHSELFQMTPEMTPSCVAGVPPDYFCEDGQLWGNPLYDWKAHAKDEYAWWMLRLTINFELYDRVRIDHFRGFSSFWSVEAKEKTARVGCWVAGPGMDLFDRIAKAFPDAPIIAEDLGEADDELVCFLEKTGFPGMRVLQFGFDPTCDNTHIPHNYPKNCVAYTGTHDNNTMLGWLWEASEEQRAYALEYSHFSEKDWGKGGPMSPVCREMIRLVWQSHADLAIAPIQDVLGFGGDTRMNVPGTPSGNWSFRVTQNALDSMDINGFNQLNRLYRRS